MAGSGRWSWVLTAVLLALVLVAPFILYPVFVMEALCFALFACAFNLLLGYVGLLSFGHAAFFGGAAYITAHTVKIWGFPPELGILEREIKRVPHGRAIVIPLSDKTRGHGSHTVEALWKDELVKLLKETEK